MLVHFPLYFSDEEKNEKFTHVNKYKGIEHQYDFDMSGLSYILNALTLQLRRLVHRRYQQQNMDDLVLVEIYMPLTHRKCMLPFL